MLKTMLIKSHTNKKKIYKKKLGQNFLTDHNIKNKILKYINIKNTDIIVEIGAGNGTISKTISKLSNHSFFIEIDKNLIDELQDNIKKKNAKVYNDDFLKFNLNDLVKKYKKIRIIGNIPYKITSKIINLIEIFSNNIIDVHLIVQKEFANNLLNFKKNNKLNLIAQYNFNINKYFDISSDAFTPKPKIISTFLKIKPRFKKNYLINYAFFKKTIKKFFITKRKKIKQLTNEKIIKKYININERAENLNLRHFVRLSNLLYITKKI